MPRRSDHSDTRPPGPGSRPAAGSRPAKGSRRKAAKRGALLRPAFLTDEDTGSRLQKFLATAGVDSRRNCEDFIVNGRVTVDGHVVTNPAQLVHPEQQDVRLDGERLRMPRYRYFIVNKPKGVVCTNRDPAGRPRAVDLVPNSSQRLFTVGRLDENTHGLLLITNDGALAEHLAHPRYEVVRRYRVQVAGVPEPSTLNELKQGMHFSEGFFRFHSVKILKRQGKSTFLELELREGKNREIRRLLARAGHKVIDLQRIAFGPVRLGPLEVGRCRELHLDEVKELYAFVTGGPEKRERSSTRRKPAAKRRARSSASRNETTKRSEAVAPDGKGRRGASRHDKPAPGPQPRTGRKKSSRKVMVKGRSKRTR
ncbi:MAG: pseudouridine synthase [Planctomycetaceae bacterium]